MQANSQQCDTTSTNLFADLAKQVADEKIAEYFRLYGKDDGAEHDLDFIFDVIRQNLSYANAFTPSVFARCRKVQNLFAKLNSSETPLSGHRVKITGDGYMDCERGILNNMYRDWDEGYAAICQAGSAHLCSFEITRGFGVPLDISGGPFHSISRNELKRLDTVQSTYWFWGDRACGNGGINLNVDVARWVYTASKGG